MRVVLTAWNERNTCTWCEREKECVTAAFADGFLDSAPLCWKCLQKAVKVRSRQVSTNPPRAASTDAPRTAKPATQTREQSAGAKSPGPTSHSPE